MDLMDNQFTDPKEKDMYYYSYITQQADKKEASLANLAIKVNQKAERNTVT